MAEGLADRLDDCKRTFRVAAVINGAGAASPQPFTHSCRITAVPSQSWLHLHVTTAWRGHAGKGSRTPSARMRKASRIESFTRLHAGANVVRRLAGGRAGIEEVLLLDTSAEMLERARQQEVLRLEILHHCSTTTQHSRCSCTALPVVLLQIWMQTAGSGPHGLALLQFRADCLRTAHCFRRTEVWSITCTGGASKL